MRICKLCESTENIQSHHIVSRKQQPALIDCKFNQVDLCILCHNGPQGVHHGGVVELKKLRLDKQNEYFEIFSEEYYEIEEIRKILKIRQKDVAKLIRPLIMEKGMYKKEDIIRQCMGGRLYV